MDKRLLQLFEQLKDIYESTGHPICPCCGEEFDHGQNCIFDDLMKNPPKDDIDWAGLILTIVLLSPAILL